MLRPTPELSFSVRELGCIAGIVITASHNPREYNGYKVYWEDGAQITPPHDKNILAEVAKVTDFSQVKTMMKSEAEAGGLLVKKELSATEVRTRRYDVLSDILNVNNYEAIGEQRAEEAKRLLSNYSGMTQKLKKGLEDIGFIFDQSDHQKVKYYGDDRYTIIYASTPSDKGHGGKNNVRNTISAPISPCSVKVP